MNNKSLTPTGRQTDGEFILLAMKARKKLMVLDIFMINPLKKA